MNKFATCIVASAAILLCQQDGRAQAETPKLEIGAQFSTLRLGDFDSANQAPGITPINADRKQIEPGVGGRLTYNVTDNVALETEVNLFPRYRNPRPGNFSNPEGGTKVQALFGAKVGARGRRAGVFGKVRPGFIRFSNYLAVGEAEVFTFPTGRTEFVRQTPVSAAFFTVDVGGVVELYPSRRTLLRFDVGDTIIRYGNQPPRELNPGYTRHNLQASVGFGFRL